MTDLRLVPRPVPVTAARPRQPEPLIASLHGDTEALIASFVDAAVQAADDQAAEILQRASTKARETIALANRIHEAVTSLADDAIRRGESLLTHIRCLTDRLQELPEGLASSLPAVGVLADNGWSGTALRCPGREAPADGVARRRAG